jgi:hypothetical protein
MRHTDDFLETSRRYFDSRAGCRLRKLLRGALIFTVTSVTLASVAVVTAVAAARFAENRPASSPAFIPSEAQPIPPVRPEDRRGYHITRTRRAWL